MEGAYVDASAVLSIAFQEPGYEAVDQRLRGFSRLWSSHLLEAELRAAYARNNLIFEPGFIEGIEWVAPVRPLSREIAAALEVGYLRGADLWHVAAALYQADDPREVTFVTMDNRQRTVAAALGFQT